MGLAVELGSGCVDPSPASSGPPLISTPPHPVAAPSRRLAISFAPCRSSSSRLILEERLHLLRSSTRLFVILAPQIPWASADECGALQLDLEHASLLSTLSKLVEQEADFVTSSDDGTPRVVASGIAATYDEGLAHLKSHSPSDGGSRSNNGYLPPNGTNAPPSTIKALLWLGSSIGNFSRSDAAAFVKNIAENVLDVGDSFLIGIDNCNDGAMVANGYDDPQGVTRRFIFEGVEVGGRTLHGDVGGDGGMRAKNFDYVSRWNARVGRHEVRSFLFFLSLCSSPVSAGVPLLQGRQPRHPRSRTRGSAGA